jgi:hypothetical protein
VGRHLRRNRDLDGSLDLVPVVDERPVLPG